MSKAPRTVAAEYFENWLAKDYDALRAIFADDMTFDGPMGHTTNGDESVAGMKGLGGIITDIRILKVWVDGPDVLTWYELHTSIAEPSLTVNWSHIEDGLVRSAEALFDPRPIIEAMSRK